MSTSRRWPKDRQIESVANKLREADKGKDLQWWRGTGRALLPVLAEALEEEQEDLLAQLAVAESTAGGAGSALLQFSVFPALRPIDLRTEAPFPGLPSEIARKGGPRAMRTWWVAPPGAGKTLVGRWLAAQHGWEFPEGARWSEIQWPAHGNVFVELSSVDEIAPTAVEAIPADVRVCIATPHAPPRINVRAAGDTDAANAQRPSRGEGDTDAASVEPSSRAGGDSDAANAKRPSQGDPPEPTPSAFDDFELVHTEPAASWIFSLIGWAAARVKPGGGFDGARIERMLRDPDLQRMFETPGELLGFLGMIDEVGVDELEAKTGQPQRWIRAWLKLLVERPDRAVAAGIHELLRRRGAELLLEVEQARLRRGLPRELRAEDWAALIPRTEAPPVDRDHLLALATSQASDALAQIRLALQPDPASVVGALQSMGIFADAGADRLALRPAWVATTLEGLAAQQLYASGSEGIGALLLSSLTAEHAVESLCAEIRARDHANASACATVTDPRSAEQVAALDGAFRATGLAVLEGAELPVDLLRKIWDSHMGFVAERYAGLPPQPVLAIASSDAWYGPGALGTWFLAALVISRALHAAGVELPCSALSPWPQLPVDVDERERCLQALVYLGHLFPRTLDVASDDPRQRAVYRLGGELLERNGVLRRGSAILEIQLPDLLVRLALDEDHGVPARERDRLFELPCGLGALEEACQRRQVPLDRVLSRCWGEWSRAPGRSPPMAWLRAPHPGLRAAARQLWMSAPGDAMTPALYQMLGSFARGLEDLEVWQWLSTSLWTGWVEHWSNDGGAVSFVAPFSVMPEAVAIQAVRAGRLGPYAHEARRALWGRFPGPLLALIDELAVEPAGGHGTLSDLVWSAPAESTAAAVERAKQWIAAPERFPATPSWVTRWLMDVVARRSPGWRDAYELLVAPRIAAATRSPTTGA